MAFDDQLKRAFDTLTDRLRDEIAHQVQAAMDELSASARHESEAAVAVALAAATPPPAPEGAPVAEPAPRVGAAGSEQLLEGMRAMDAARSLTDVLDALIAATARDGAAAGVWLVRRGGLHHWQSTGVDRLDVEVALDAQRALAEAARTNAPAWDDGFAVPLVLAGTAVAVLYVTSASSQVASHDVEIFGRHAASRLEAMTAFKTARAMADSAAASGAKDAAGAQADAANAEEHVSAQRYARLLVSEIKLYHEQAVIEGRRDRDLATRLGGEIARARVMYEQRVPPHIRQRADHFHDELVRTLAGGDASLLELRA